MHVVYSQLLPILRAVARQHGYALGEHGSGMRDLDLIAAPWVEQASEPRVLVEALREAIGGHISEWEDHNPMLKPHGRLAWAIRPLEQNPEAKLYIDLSVIPMTFSLHPDNPKPQTFEAAMLAYEGACAALREALAQLADCMEVTR